MKPETLEDAQRIIDLLNDQLAKAIEALEKKSKTVIANP